MLFPLSPWQWFRYFLSLSITRRTSPGPGWHQAPAALPWQVFGTAAIAWAGCVFCCYRSNDFPSRLWFVVPCDSALSALKLVTVVRVESTSSAKPTTWLFETKLLWSGVQAVACDLSASVGLHCVIPVPCSPGTCRH